ncbi:UDP-glucose/GDP-mannose dehydrogenase family protein [Rossellomorea vietnamensis]|uniref:UDP-glucose 6-dehydrogenase n=1 Tax=Rossellomorea vietnamensis TaxID=218284 RepID=A0A5D4NH54_9BACI|nr:UDP-glucose/GDP-mannose dehydrogenase family protein [Rossellomorea vietnamensis]TYS12938.1 UDP-glucose/GDP-mannose dehydrogenase family protein [Rossellomorea vietnamensis]
MNVCVIGTGYVGLVSGVCFSDIGNNVTCVDLDENKINNLKKGIVPIYEPGLKDLVIKNTEQGRLSFTTQLNQGMDTADVIIIAVGTPEKASGEADLQYVEAVAKSIGENLNGYKVIVTKSTVPVGTNRRVKELVAKYSGSDDFDVASNPEFLREGSAIYDTMNMERAIIGVESDKAGEILTELHKPFNTTVMVTTIETAEMIKYASNAFLATKISFINEIANICEKLNADVTDVAKGMGLDDRIGSKFLNAGIGYGGSCFPKDTKALIQISGEVEHDFQLLKSVIEVNNKQQRILMEKAEKRFGSLSGKNVALLGLAFKPNTDDMREAASIVIADELVKQGANVKGFDPIAKETARRVLPEQIDISGDIEATLEDADIVMILTDWDEVKKLDLGLLAQKQKKPVIFDGRNCFSLDHVAQFGLEYHSIGRPSLV